MTSEFVVVETEIFEISVLDLVCIPNFSFIRQLWILRGGASGCGHFPKFLGFGTWIFEFAVSNLVLVPIFMAIRPFFHFEGVG